VDRLLHLHEASHSGYYGVMIWIVMMLERWLDASERSLTLHELPEAALPTPAVLDARFAIDGPRVLSVEACKHPDQPADVHSEVRMSVLAPPVGSGCEWPRRETKQHVVRHYVSRGVQFYDVDTFRKQQVCQSSAVRRNDQCAS